MTATELKEKVINFGRKYAPSLNKTYEITPRNKITGEPLEDYKIVTQEKYFDHHAQDKEFGDETMIEATAQYLGINICVIDRKANQLYFKVNDNKCAIWLYNAANHFECISHLHDQKILEAFKEFNNADYIIWDQGNQYSWNQNALDFNQAAQCYEQGKYYNALCKFLAAENNDFTAIKIRQCYAQILANFAQANLKNRYETIVQSEWQEFGDEIHKILEMLDNEMTEIIGQSDRTEQID